MKISKTIRVKIKSYTLLNKVTICMLILVTMFIFIPFMLRIGYVKDFIKFWLYPLLGYIDIYFTFFGTIIGVFSTIIIFLYKKELEKREVIYPLIKDIYAEWFKYFSSNRAELDSFNNYEHKPFCIDSSKVIELADKLEKYKIPYYLIKDYINYSRLSGEVESFINNITESDLKENQKSVKKQKAKELITRLTESSKEITKKEKEHEL